MLPPCVLLIEEALPEIRKRVAKEMSAAGSNQVEISRLLGVSQAMVSKYLKEERIRSPNMADYIENLTCDLTVTALSNGKRSDLTAKFCSACMTMKKNNIINEAYLERTGFDLPDVSCFRIEGDLDLDMLKDELVRSLSYLNQHPIKDLIPAVKVNIASCTKDCQDIGNVVSFPGGLTYVDGRLEAIKPPARGSSRHLASILNALKRKNPWISGIMNIAYSEKVDEALSATDLDLFTLHRETGLTLEDLEDIDLKGYGCLLDPGDFGIEPCLYILGNSALSVAAKAARVQKWMDRGQG